MGIIPNPRRSSRIGEALAATAAVRARKPTRTCRSWSRWANRNIVSNLRKRIEVLGSHPASKKRVASRADADGGYPQCPMGLPGLGSRIPSPPATETECPYSPRTVTLTPAPRVHRDVWGMIMAEEQEPETWSAWDRPPVVLTPAKDCALSSTAASSPRNDPWMVADTASLHWYPKSDTASVASSSTDTHSLFDKPKEDLFERGSILWAFRAWD